MRTEEVIKGIEAHRALLGMSNNQFAKALGVDPAEWCRFRKGKRIPSQAFLDAVATTFPELEPVVGQIFGNKRPLDQSLTQEPKPRQNRVLGAVRAFRNIMSGR